MNSRSFLAGLGIGLMIGAALLQLVYAVGGTEPRSAALLSEEELRAQAEQLGLVVERSDHSETAASPEPSVTETLAAGTETPETGGESPDASARPTEPATTPSVAEPSGANPVALPGAASPAGPQQPEQPADPAVSPPAEPQRQESRQDENAASPAPHSEERKEVEVYIRGALTASQIAELLASRNIVDDAAEFDRKIREAKLQTKIRAGRYTFYEGMSYDEVIAKIVSRP